MNLYLRYFLPAFVLTGNVRAELEDMRKYVDKRNNLLKFAQRWSGAGIALFLLKLVCDSMAWETAGDVIAVPMLLMLLVAWFWLILWATLLRESNK